MSLEKMRGLIVKTLAGTSMFYPGGGPIPGDKIICYPVSKTVNVALSIDNNPEIQVGDTVAIDRTAAGFFVFKPLYPADPVPQPQPPGDPEIILLQKLTNGFGPFNVGHGTYEIIGHYSVYWDGLGTLWVSGAPDSIAAFSVDDTLRFYKCYGYVDYPGAEGVLTGPLNITDDTVASGAIFWKHDWLNLFKCYVYNNQGNSDGSSALYLINVRPL